MIRRQSEMKTRTMDNCHEGTGTVNIRSVLTKNDSGCGIMLMHDDILPPGTVIGEHPHEDFEEAYFIAEGTGTMIMDGTEHHVQAGDIGLCRVGHSHGIKNDSDAPMRLIVFGMGGTPPG